MSTPPHVRSPRPDVGVGRLRSSGHARLIAAALGATGAFAAITAAHSASQATPATPTTDVAPAAAPMAFVTAADIAAGVTEGSVTVIDVRPIGPFLAGHAPGAIHLDDETVRGPRDGLPVQFRRPAANRASLAAAGVPFDAPVLLMGAADDPLAATMVAHVLLQVGHSHVRVLDGGWDAWAANHPVTRAFAASARTITTDDAPGDAPAATPAAGTIDTVTLDDIRDDVGWNEVVFVDARPARHYRGEVAAWPRSGHIPGAINLDWKRLVESDNHHRLRPTADLRRIVQEEVGLSPDARTIVYCGTGREATLLALTLRHVLGMDDVALFEGSWVAYAADATMPSEVGPRVPPRVRVQRDGRVSFSGQPDLGTLTWLAGEGVGTIVNCRSQWELANRMPYDASAAEALGLALIEIPLGGDDGYDPAAVDRLAEVLAATDGPVHIHCSSGGRARTLWTAWLIEHGGLTPDAARERLAAIGGGPTSLERLLGRRISSRVTDEPVTAGDE